MKLTIKPNFNKGFIKKKIEAFLKNLDTTILMRMQKVGEEFIIAVRGLQTYKDRTGNLRSSTGYIILKNGKAFYEGGFQPVAGGNVGATKGQSFIARIAKEYPQGWVFIGCAGMSYAAAVEAKGFDVISGGALLAKEALVIAIEKIQKKVG